MQNRKQFFLIHEKQVGWLTTQSWCNYPIIITRNKSNYNSMPVSNSNFMLLSVVYFQKHRKSCGLATFAAVQMRIAPYNLIQEAKKKKTV